MSAAPVPDAAAPPALLRAAGAALGELHRALARVGAVAAESGLPFPPAGALLRPAPAALAAPDLLPLTAPEVRRLLRLLTASARERRFRLAWSRWRRVHQAGARHGHVARRARAQPSLKLPVPAAALPPRDEPLPSASAPPPVILTDTQWARVASLLPPSDRSRGGRPPRDPRPIVAALLWLARTGAAWRELPTVYGAWISPYRYYRRWTASGLWPRILQIFQEGEADL